MVGCRSRGTRKLLLTERAAITGASWAGFTHNCELVREKRSLSTDTPLGSCSSGCGLESSPALGYHRGEDQRPGCGRGQGERALRRNRIAPAGSAEGGGDQ